MINTHQFELAFRVMILTAKTATENLRHRVQSLPIEIGQKFWSKHGQANKRTVVTSATPGGDLCRKHHHMTTVPTDEQTEGADDHQSDVQPEGEQLQRAAMTQNFHHKQMRHSTYKYAYHCIKNANQNFYQLNYLRGIE